MKTLFAIFLSLLPIAAFAQEPTLLSLYGIGGSGEDQLLPNITNTQGGYILHIETGSAYGTGNIDSFCSYSGWRDIFIKYNYDATIEWSKCYGEDGDSFLAYLYPTRDSGFILGGLFNSGSGWGFLICKEDALGSILWQKSYSRSKGVLLDAMIATDDGGFIMCGRCTYIDTNFTIHHGSFLYPDIAVLKVDSLGNKVWAKVIGGSFDEQVFNLILAPDDGCYIFGATTSNDFDCIGLHNAPDSGSDAYLVRLDNNGNILWHRDLGGTGDDGHYGWGVADGKGGVILASGSNSIDGDVSHNIGNYDYWVLEVDSNNNILWNNCFGSIYPEFPTSICKTTDGNIWITGESSLQGGEVDTSYGDGDAWIVLTDSVGNFLNAKVLGSSRADEGTIIYPLTSNNIITGGFYSHGDGSFATVGAYGIADAFLATFAPQNQTSVKQISANGGVYIYPNPAHGTLYITLAAPFTSGVDVVINNILGQRVYCNTSMNKSLLVDVSEWPAGMYFVKITDENTLINVTKIEIQ